ncbi:MAG: WD40 repeat domain-containing protein [Candidatus Hydrogenedentes bacterium]|nr:WD40 repeat domain-containing protein [Candidatus Hydrogenedentota bacterium]
MRVQNGKALVPMLCLLTFAALRGDAAEPVVLTSPPSIWRVDVEAGVMLCRGQTGPFCAIDLETGDTRWTYAIPRNWQYFGGSIGLRHTLFTTNAGLFLWEHQTGTETLRLNASGGRGKLKHASLENDDRWACLWYENDLVLCELATRRQFRLPVTASGSVGGVWMPDGKTYLYTEILADRPAPPVRAQVWFWEPGTAEPVRGGVLESRASMFVAGILPGGQLVIRETESGSLDNWKYRVVEPATGTVVREWQRPYGSPVWYGSEVNPTRWHVYDGRTNSLDVHDLITGDLLLTVQLPGMKTLGMETQPRAFGKDWVLTRDERNNQWLVPLEKDGMPRRILDGSRYLTGSVHRILPPYLLSLEEDSNPDTQSWALYTIDGLEKKRSWTYAGERGGFGEPMLSADKCKLLISLHRAENDTHTSKTLLLADGQPEPLLEIEGSAMALSPEAGHVLVPKGERGELMELVDVEKRASVMAFTSSREYGIGAVAFSPDSHRVAVFHSPSLTVVDLVEGLPRREMSFPATDQDPFIYTDYGSIRAMCFSPDETLLLAGGYGKAWMFNAATGECLHTYVEESQFAPFYRYRQGGFLQNLSVIGADYLGKVSDRYNTRPHLKCSFVMDGLRAVTFAQNQLIRVWDTQTGRETGMFKTGLPETRNSGGEIRNNCVLSANCSYLLSYNGDGHGTTTLWETASGRKLKEYRLPKEAWNVAVADDGRAVYAMVGGDLHILPGRD